MRLYLSSADNNKQRLPASITRSMRQGFCAIGFADVSDFIDTAYETLRQQVLTDSNHVLAHLLVHHKG